MQLGGVPNAFQTLLAFAAFVVPGFLLRAGYVRSRAMTADDPGLYVLAEAVTGSLVVLAVTWWWRGEDVLAWVQAGTLYGHKDKAYWFFLALLVGPYLAGVIAGWTVNTLSNAYNSLRPAPGSPPKGWRHVLFYWLDVGGVFNGPSLWDDFWEEIGRKPSRIMLKITTPTGRTAVGAVKYGTWAQSSPRPKELFLESVYRQNAQGQWEPISGHEGMLFHESSIESIEFFRKEPAGDTREAILPSVESTKALGR